MAAQSPVVTSQWNMTVSPTQMMHPVSQMIQPMLKEALPRPTVRANSRQENKAHYDVLMLSKNVTSVCFFFFFSDCLWWYSVHVFLQNVGWETQSVVLLWSPGSHWPLVGHAAVQSIPTQLPCTQHLIHAVAPAPEGRGKERGKVRGEEEEGEEEVTEGWSRERMKWCFTVKRVKTLCCVLCCGQKAE